MKKNHQPLFMSFQTGTRTGWIRLHGYWKNLLKYILQAIFTIVPNIKNSGTENIEIKLETVIRLFSSVSGYTILVDKQPR